MTNIPAPGADLATDELRTYVIMVRPGMVPVVKGPLPDKKWVEDMLRELYQQYADAQCMVIDMPITSWPQSGIEWIDMYGDKRRKPIRAFIAAVPASEPVGKITHHAAGTPDHYVCTELFKPLDHGTLIYAAANAPVSGMPDLAKLTKWSYSQTMGVMMPNSPQPRRKFYAVEDVEALFPVPQAPDTPNPTGETK